MLQSLHSMVEGTSGRRCPAEAALAEAAPAWQQCTCTWRLQLCVFLWNLWLDVIWPRFGCTAKKCTAKSIHVGNYKQKLEVMLIGLQLYSGFNICRIQEQILTKHKIRNVGGVIQSERNSWTLTDQDSGDSNIGSDMQKLNTCQLQKSCYICWDTWSSWNERLELVIVIAV